MCLVTVWQTPLGTILSGTYGATELPSADTAASFHTIPFLVCLNLVFALHPMQAPLLSRVPKKWLLFTPKQRIELGDTKTRSKMLVKASLLRTAVACILFAEAV